MTTNAVVEEGDGDNDDNTELVSTIANVERQFSIARTHVMKYQAQRALVKHVIALAKSDVQNNLPLQFCCQVITIDMGQNLGLPNFEAEQPGDTYYFLPFTVLLFGIVDNATEDGSARMDAYVWREQDGDRGANNISSCYGSSLR